MSKEDKFTSKGHTGTVLTHTYRSQQIAAGVIDRCGLSGCGGGHLVRCGVGGTSWKWRRWRTRRRWSSLGSRYRWWRRSIADSTSHWSGRHRTSRRWGKGRLSRRDDRSRRRGRRTSVGIAVHTARKNKRVNRVNNNFVFWHFCDFFLHFPP